MNTTYIKTEALPNINLPSECLTHLWLLSQQCETSNVARGWGHFPSRFDEANLMRQVDTGFSVRNTLIMSKPNILLSILIHAEVMDMKARQSKLEWPHAGFNICHNFMIIYHIDWRRGVCNNPQHFSVQRHTFISFRCHISTSRYLSKWRRNM